MPDLWMDVDVALSEVPVNIMPLVDDTDFKTIEDGPVAYNAAGMDLRWNFTDTAGNTTSTAVTPTSSGVHDWNHQGDGMYTLEIPASSGTINNDTEGFGWFTGRITGILPFRGPVIGFRAAALNDALIDGGDNLDVNVTQFGGTNGTFSGGRPEVNTSHVAGTAQTAGDIVSYLNGIVLYKGTIHSSGNDTTHIVFTSATLADDSIIDNMLVIEDTSGNVKECKWVIDWDLATATATLDSALSFTPEASNDRYWLLSVKRNVNVDNVDSGSANKIADHVRRRTQANVEASSDGDTISDARSAYGLIQQAQNSNTVDNPGFLTVRKVDGTTELEQIPVDPDAGADPIVGVG